MLRNAITERCRVLFLVNPNNPTGTSLGRADIEFIAQLAIEHNLLLVADEVYRKIYYDGKQHISLVGIPEIHNRTIFMDSFSKTYAMTGWSIGYIATTPELAKPLNILRLARPGKVNAPAQRAALAALQGPQDCVHEMVSEYDRRRKSALKKLASVKGFTCGVPDSAFYFFGRFDANMTSAEMVDHLYSRKVAVRSGAGSGAMEKVGFESAIVGHMTM